MDINQNIIRIRTSSQMGSGIMYPCEAVGKYKPRNEYKNSQDYKHEYIPKSKFEYEYQYKQNFVIFTSRHLVDDLIDASDLKKRVDFDIYDKHGMLIKMEQISSVRLFCDSLVNGESINEDIAVFLISFENKIEIELETKILWNDINLNIIYIEGFPRVLYDNDICSKIQLVGKYKGIFPLNNKIGVFQITDDYHWYSNINDLKLFQGFSGGAVYKNERNSCVIVGLNQSVLNINDGENPFKLLYYYKIRYVLEYLREKGCIIFRRNKDQSVSVRWIYRGK